MRSERFSRGAWVPWSLPALEVAPEYRAPVLALNDIAIVRASGRQVRLTTEVDGYRVVRIAGDGYIVSTPIGSSAYALAAGGPLLAPNVNAFLFAPLAAHGGSCPPVVVGAASVIRLNATAGHGAARLEVDGGRRPCPPTCS
jgi:NAD+ kinase